MERITQEDIEKLARFMGWKHLKWCEDPLHHLEGTPPGTLPDAKAIFPPSRRDLQDRYCDGNGMVWLVHELHNTWGHHRPSHELITVDFDQNDCSRSFTPSVGQNGSLHRKRGRSGNMIDLPHETLWIIIQHRKDNQLGEFERPERREF